MNLWQPRCERARPTTSPVSVGTGTRRPDLTGTATATHQTPDRGRGAGSTPHPVDTAQFGRSPRMTPETNETPSDRADWADSDAAQGHSEATERHTGLWTPIVGVNRGRLRAGRARIGPTSRSGAHCGHPRPPRRRGPCRRWDDRHPERGEGAPGVGGGPATAHRPGPTSRRVAPARWGVGTESQGRRQRRAGARGVYQLKSIS